MAEEKKKETIQALVVKWGKRGLFGGLALLVVALFVWLGGGQKTSSKTTSQGSKYAPPSRAQEVNFPIPKAEAATGFPRKYAKVVDLSNMTEKSPPQTISIPSKASGEWVSVILPTTYYVVKKFPSVKVSYDYGAGYPVVVDGPDVEIAAKNVPPAFDMRGVTEGGTLTVRCYLKPDSWATTKNVSSYQAKSFSSLKKAHKKSADEDVPRAPQIM